MVTATGSITDSTTTSHHHEVPSKKKKKKHWVFLLYHRQWPVTRASTQLSACLYKVINSLHYSQAAFAIYMCCSNVWAWCDMEVLEGNYNLPGENRKTYESSKKKFVNDGTGTAEHLTEPCWISSYPLSNNYSPYAHAHVQTESWRAVNIGEHAYPGIHLLTQCYTTYKMHSTTTMLLCWTCITERCCRSSRWVRFVAMLVGWKGGDFLLYQSVLQKTSEEQQPTNISGFTSGNLVTIAPWDSQNEIINSYSKH